MKEKKGLGAQDLLFFFLPRAFTFRPVLKLLSEMVLQSRDRLSSLSFRESDILSLTNCRRGVKSKKKKAAVKITYLEAK